MTSTTSRNNVESAFPNLSTETHTPRIVEPTPFCAAAALSPISPAFCGPPQRIQNRTNRRATRTHHRTKRESTRPHVCEIDVQLHAVRSLEPRPPRLCALYVYVVSTRQQHDPASSPQMATVCCALYLLCRNSRRVLFRLCVSEAWS